MIYDGDCHFCRRWIERWREQTGDRVDYDSSQQIGVRFPEIAASEFAQAVILILPGGDVYRGAEAVFRSLSLAPRRQWLFAFYQKVPVFARISEVLYGAISCHRQFASAITRALWGRDVRRPSYEISRHIFLRALGLIYLIAFLSLWVQLDGLVGERGILPAQHFFAAVRAHYGSSAIFALPSLCWVDASDRMLHGLCLAGVVSSLLLVIGIIPLALLLLCFVSYLSLTIAGQTFLSFQWDILLLETGFLAFFVAPVRLTLWRAAPLSTVGLFLLKFLLFKLMFMSGVVKLTSGDDCWWNLTALDYHYWTQPLPTVFAWFADKHPEWFKKFSVGFCLSVEIIAPFFIWAPRRLRLSAAALLIFLQLAIAITGNYCFFNLLTIALCLLLIDDTCWRRRCGIEQGRGAVLTARPADRLVNYAAGAMLLLTLPLNLWLCYSAIKPEAEWPQPLGALYSYVESLRIANGYGLFRVMTKERPEIQVEGSSDGVDWQPYEFKWKPGPLDRAPRWNAPHQPRLDWQMWFAALGSERDKIWFTQLAERLLENESSVTRLFARNPFPEHAPAYVRARLFKYEFTTADEHRANGDWWKRREVGEYFPAVSLRDLQQ